jgi:hypothetical protein
VSAREKRKEHDENRGYTVLTLQDTLARFDPMTFRKFKQGFCQDPVAIRVVNIAGLIAPKKEVSAPKVPRWKDKKNDESPAGEHHAGELECHAAGKDKPVTAKFDNKAFLPEKNGRPDQEVYAKFKKEGLRRRIWDSIVAGRCARCDGDIFAWLARSLELSGKMTLKTILSFFLERGKKRKRAISRLVCNCLGGSMLLMPGCCT